MIYVVFSRLWLWQAFLIVRDDSITSPLRMKKAKTSFVDMLFQYQENHPFHIAIKIVQWNKIISTLTFQILNFNNSVHFIGCPEFWWKNLVERDKNARCPWQRIAALSPFYDKWLFPIDLFWRPFHFSQFWTRFWTDNPSCDLSWCVRKNKLYLCK